MRREIKVRVFLANHAEKVLSLSVGDDSPTHLTQGHFESGDSPAQNLKLCDWIFRDGHLVLENPAPSHRIFVNGQEGNQFSIRTGDVVEMGDYIVEVLDVPALQEGGSESTRILDVHSLRKQNEFDSDPDKTRKLMRPQALNAHEAHELKPENLENHQPRSKKRANFNFHPEAVRSLPKKLSIFGVAATLGLGAVVWGVFYRHSTFPFPKEEPTTDAAAPENNAPAGAQVTQPVAIQAAAAPVVQTATPPPIAQVVAPSAAPQAVAISATPVPVQNRNLAAVERPSIFDPMQSTRDFLTAARSGHIRDAAVILDQSGIGVDSRDRSGSTALIYAAASANIEMIQFLIGRGANVNMQDFKGSTALMWAAYKGRTDIVKYLLKVGARPGIRRKDGDRAIDIARNWKHNELVKVLNRASR